MSQTFMITTLVRSVSLGFPIFNLKVRRTRRTITSRQVSDEFHMVVEF
jgi:hypothetical protein